MNRIDGSAETEYKISKAVGGDDEMPVLTNVRVIRREERAARFNQTQVEAAQRLKQAQKEKEERLEEDIKREEAKIKAINTQYSLVKKLLIALVSIAAGAAVLRVVYWQSSLSTYKDELYSLQTEYEALKEENDNKENSINSSIDADEIYRIATEQLGMTYPQKHQVVIYDKTESEYVVQYETVPKQ